MTTEKYYRVHAIFEPCELRFKLENPDIITPTLEKKIKAMGFPKIVGSVLTKCVDASCKGVVIVDSKSYLSHKFYDGLQTPKCDFPISSPIGDGHFEFTYSPSDKSILLKLSGTFDCALKREKVELTMLKNAKCLYFRSLILQDTKGKEIRGPKDELDCQHPLEARAGSNYLDEYQAPVRITLEKF